MQVDRQPQAARPSSLSLHLAPAGMLALTLPAATDHAAPTWPWWHQQAVRLWIPHSASQAGRAPQAAGTSRGRTRGPAARSGCPRLVLGPVQQSDMRWLVLKRATRSAGHAIAVLACASRWRCRPKSMASCLGLDSAAVCMHATGVWEIQTPSKTDAGLQPGRTSARAPDVNCCAFLTCTSHVPWWHAPAWCHQELCRYAWHVRCTQAAGSANGCHNPCAGCIFESLC